MGREFCLEDQASQPAQLRVSLLSNFQTQTRPELSWTNRAQITLFCPSHVHGTLFFAFLRSSHLY